MTKEVSKEPRWYHEFIKVRRNGVIIRKKKTWKSGRWLIRTLPERILKPSVHTKGYHIFGIRVNGKHMNLKVHRVVAETFIPNPENKPHVNHKNGIKADNRVENLEWATRVENMQHAHANGLMNIMMGEQHYKSKLNEQQVLEIRKSPLSPYKLAKIYNIGYSTADGIKRGRTWKHLL